MPVQAVEEETAAEQRKSCAVCGATSSCLWRRHGERQHICNPCSCRLRRQRLKVSSKGRWSPSHTLLHSPDSYPGSSGGSRATSGAGRGGSRSRSGTPSAAPAAKRVRTSSSSADSDGSDGSSHTELPALATGADRQPALSSSPLPTPPPTPAHAVAAVNAAAHMAALHAAVLKPVPAPTPLVPPPLLLKTSPPLIPTPVAAVAAPVYGYDPCMADDLGPIGHRLDRGGSPLPELEDAALIDWDTVF